MSHQGTKVTSSNFQYDWALVCKALPRSVCDGLSLTDHEPLDVYEADRQHEAYLAFLRKSGLHLIEIEPNEALPDCVFVEDTLVAVGNRVFITNPGAESRRAEIVAVREALTRVADDLGLQLCETADRASAFIDGGDVLYTGYEFFVGLSSRTNQKGADELQAAFADIPVITCQVSEGLHLKSAVTMLADDVILVGTSANAHFIRYQIEQKSHCLERYRFCEVAEDERGSANVLIFNGRLLYPAAFEHIYRPLPEFQAHPSACALVNSEFTKIDGCLTCRCVLLRSAAAPVV